MKYSIYNITENKNTLELLDIETIKSSVLFKTLCEYKFEFDENDYSFKIILVTNLAFFQNKSSLLSELRKYNSRNSVADKTYYPLLILYSNKSHFADDNEFRKKGTKYWDTCIWNHLVDIGPLDKSGIEEDERVISYKINLVFALQQIEYYSLADSSFQYNSPRTIEYLEFITRIYQNSYLEKVDNGKSHADDITPFPFFEEYEKYKSVIKHNLFSQENKSLLTWNVLIIDDIDSHVNHIKNVLTRSEFGQLFSLPDRNPGEITLFIKSVRNISEASKELSQQSYDVILLDYLLEMNSDNVRELGIRLFDKEKIKKYKKSVSDCIWILPISSFNFAFIDHLRENNIELEDEFWKITRGADPINTPNSFLLSFASILNRQFQICKESLAVLSEFSNILDIINNGKYLDRPTTIHYADIYYKYINYKTQLFNIIQAEQGLMASAFRHFIYSNTNSTFKMAPESLNWEKILGYYEQLLYNLTFRRYDGNEEIVLLFDMIRNEIHEN